MSVGVRGADEAKVTRAEDVACVMTTAKTGYRPPVRRSRSPSVLHGLHRLADARTHLVGVHHRRERDFRVKAHKERLRRGRYPC
jgi:hypothetical protein